MTDVPLLIAGLGNPGESYSRHRHNIGFMAADAIAARHHFAPWRQRYRGLMCEGVLSGRKTLLLKPMIYMNDSGASVGEAAGFMNRVALLTRPPKPSKPKLPEAGNGI